jgi:NAD(P)-dependent dehydrogenase (short-subunit alcohol dehydrogenase family)
VSVQGQSPGRLVLSLHRGGAPFLTIDLDHEVAAGPFRPAPVHPGEARESSARDVPDSALAQMTRSGTWCPDGAALAALAERLSFRMDRLPPLQLGVLLWASYLVGMEIPGRQALFRSLLIDFMTTPLPPSDTIAYGAAVQRLDAETGRVDVAATLSWGGEPFASAALSAYNRPRPVEQDIGGFFEAVGPSTRLRGRVGLVTGASRGLGSLIAAGLAAHGADVVVHYRSQRDAAEHVARQVRDLGSRAHLVEGDLCDEVTWDRIGREIKRQFGRLDVVVHNAGAPPVAVGLEEVTPAEVEDLVMRPIRASIRGHRAVLPLIAKQAGWVVGISSAATQEPVSHWWAYVLVKSSSEALMRSLATDHPTVRFLDVRPPPLRTDMTRSYPMSPGLPPAEVALRILSVLANEPPAVNYLVLDRFDGAA